MENRPPLVNRGATPVRPASKPYSHTSLKSPSVRNTPKDTPTCSSSIAPVHLLRVSTADPARRAEALLREVLPAVSSAQTDWSELCRCFDEIRSSIASATLVPDLMYLEDEALLDQAAWRGAVRALWGHVGSLRSVVSLHALVVLEDMLRNPDTFFLITESELDDKILADLINACSSEKRFIAQAGLSCFAAAAQRFPIESFLLLLLDQGVKTKSPRVSVTAVKILLDFLTKNDGEDLDPAVRAAVRARVEEMCRNKTAETRALAQNCLAKLEAL